MPISPSNNSLKKTFHWLEVVKKDFWYKHQMPIGHKSLKRFLGLVPHSQFEDAQLKKLEQIIPDIESRKLIFVKVGRILQPVYLNPPEIPSTIPRLVNVDNWNIFARCRCGCNKFLPIMMNGKEHVACYNCLPPSQYPSIGAVIINHSLIFWYGKYFIDAK